MRKTAEARDHTVMRACKAQVEGRAGGENRQAVTLVGDRTAGATANPGTFPLANGWTYTVSRWIEYTADDQVIEDRGIAPRVFVATTASDFAQGRDPVLDWALNRRWAVGSRVLRFGTGGE